MVGKIKACNFDSYRLFLVMYVGTFAERQGFEPWVPERYNGFRDRPDRPLRHLSCFLIAYKVKTFFICIQIFSFRNCLNLERKVSNKKCNALSDVLCHVKDL